MHYTRLRSGRARDRVLNVAFFVRAAERTRAPGTEVAERRAIGVASLDEICAVILSQGCHGLPMVRVPKFV